MILHSFKKSYAQTIEACGIRTLIYEIRNLAVIIQRKCAFKKTIFLRVFNRNSFIVYC